MANKVDDYFESPPLSADDQKLIDAYLQVGEPVDKLPYTDKFEGLAKLVYTNEEISREQKSHLFQRLLQLRKKGLLPRIGKFGIEF